MDLPHPPRKHSQEQDEQIWDSLWEAVQMKKHLRRSNLFNCQLRL